MSDDMSGGTAGSAMPGFPHAGDLPLLLIPPSSFPCLSQAGVPSGISPGVLSLSSWL